MSALGKHAHSSAYSPENCQNCSVLPIDISIVYDRMVFMKTELDSRGVNEMRFKSTTTSLDLLLDLTYIIKE